MSNLFGEARIAVLPDSTGFRTALIAQIEAAKAGVIVNIPVIAAGAEAAIAEEAALSTATKKRAASTKAAAVASEEEAAALRNSGVAAALARRQQEGLAAAAQLNAASLTKLAGIEEAVSLVSGDLAKSRARLAGVNAAAAESQAALDKALQTGNAQMIAAQAVVTRYVLSLRELAVANVQATIAETEEATAAARSAGAHAQATRGIVAETLALGGLRGATLAASAPFLIGATAAIVLAKSIKGASDATEELNKTNVVFGQSAGQIKEFAETTATSLGISSTEALRSAGIFGNLFRTLKISEPVSADMSRTLVKLAADLASFNNADPSRTLEALRSGLVGQARPLRVFGVFLTAARVQQQALIDTQKESVQDLTQAELVQARYNIILRDSVQAQGDVGRTAGEAANQSRFLKAQIQDLGDDLGSVLLPALTNVIGLANDYATVLRQAVKAGKDFQASLRKIPGPAGEAGGKIESFEKKVTKLYFRFAVLGPVMGAATLAERRFGAGADEAGKHVDVFTGILKAAQGAIVDLSAALITAGAKPLKNISQQLNALEVQQLKVQTGLTSGGRSAEEANIRRQIALDKKAVATSLSGTEARRQAIEDLKADQENLAQLIGEDASDARSRADKIKSAAAEQVAAAKDAAQAQADATRAFIDQFSGKQQHLQNRLTSAGLFGNADQQIAINKQIIVANKAEIAAIKDRIRRLHLHGDALKTARDEIARLIQENFNTRNAIAQLKDERKQAAVEARQAHLEALLSIAETTEQTTDDARRERALIKFDQAQIKRILGIKKRRRLTNEEAAQLDAYRVDLAQRNQALRDLVGEAKKGNNFAKSAFEFLQAQQGFAANLLGNLVPLGALQGTVGGGGAVPTDKRFAPEAGVQQQAATKAARDQGGFTGSQPATVIELLRAMVNELQAIRKGNGHPEAAYHRKATSGGSKAQAS